MKMRTNLLAILFGLSFPNLAVRGEAQAEIPASSWESFPEGVAVAIILTSRSDQEGHKSGLITVFLKNTSSTVKEYPIYGSDCGFRLFTRAANGAWERMHSDVSGYLTGTEIKPGETFTHGIGLSADDLAKIKSRSFKCSFYLYDPATKQKYTIESSPKLLVETVSK